MRRAFLVFLFSSCLVSVGAAAQDVGGAQEPICCGDDCCLIGGVCFARGEENPDNACQACDPAVSQGEFTPISGCTLPDAGTGGGGGGCAVGGSSAGAGGLSVFALFAAAAIVARRRRT